MASDAWTMHIPKKRRINIPQTAVDNLSDIIQEEIPPELDLTQQASMKIAKNMLFHQKVVELKNQSFVFKYVSAIAKRIRMPVDKLWSEPYSINDPYNYQTNEEIHIRVEEESKAKAYTDVHKWCCQIPVDSITPITIRADFITKDDTDDSKVKQFEDEIKKVKNHSVWALVGLGALDSMEKIKMSTLVYILDPRIQLKEPEPLNHNIMDSASNFLLWYYKSSMKPKLHISGFTQINSISRLTGIDPTFGQLGSGLVTNGLKVAGIDRMVIDGFKYAYTSILDKIWDIIKYVPEDEAEQAATPPPTTPTTPIPPKTPIPPIKPTTPPTPPTGETKQGPTRTSNNGETKKGPTRLFKTKTQDQYGTKNDMDDIDDAPVLTETKPHITEPPPQQKSGNLPGRILSNLITNQGSISGSLFFNANTIQFDVTNDLVKPYYDKRYNKHLHDRLRQHYEKKVIEETNKWCNHNLVVDTYVDPEIIQVTQEVLRDVRKIHRFKNIRVVQLISDDNYRTLLAECVSLKISHNQSVMLKRYATKFMMKQLKRQIGRSMHEWKSIQSFRPQTTNLSAKWK
tara:strand:+ start:10742 stop:12451 length:1710 start_codon:yes stop_codon:yes gene_type:complete